VRYLEQTRDRVLTFAASLSPEQRSFKASEREWCAIDLIEHVVMVERMTNGLLTRLTNEGAPDESRRGKGLHKDRLILDNVPARAVKVQAPEGFHPAGCWADFDALVEEFRATRERTLEIARTTDKDLRVLFAPHPFLKDLDGYQWLLLVAAHAERHVRQGEETLAGSAGSKAAG
jgi:hypothetical protein